MSKSEIEVTLVKSMEELALAYSIRRQVFMVEGEEPEEEQFDGNDFCATHLLAYIGGRVVGTMRLRVVSGAAGGSIVWERLAVLQEVRESNPWVFRALLNAARRYTDMMGLKTVLGIVENPKLKRLWFFYGFKETGEAPLIYRGHAYTPIKLSIDAGKSSQEAPTLRQAVAAMPEVFVGNNASI